MKLRRVFQAIIFSGLITFQFSLCHAQTELPRVFLLDPATLVKVRMACVANGVSVRPALQRLVRDADKLLDAAPVSVMEKTQLPPSGDRHDYMSLARYYWPDPKKPDGLPYINRDGEVNPEINSIEDRGNLERMSSTVRTLALAYYLTGNEPYAHHAAKFLRTWFLDSATRMNPNFNFAQAVKGRNNGTPSGLIESRSLAYVVDGVGLLAGFREWDRQDQDGLVRWFAEYLDWLQTSTNGTKEAAATNNHGVWFDVQVSVIALFAEKNDLARQILTEAKSKRIGKQIEPDGSQPRELARTTSAHYTLFNIQAFFALASIGANVGVDLWNFQTEDGRSIRKALDWVTPYVRGDKEWTFKQIKKFDNAEYYPFLLQASIQYNDPSYADLAWKLKGAQGASDRIHLLIGK